MLKKKKKKIALQVRLVNSQMVDGVSYLWG